MPATCRGKRISSIGALCPYPDRSSAFLSPCLALLYRSAGIPMQRSARPPNLPSGKDFSPVPDSHSWAAPALLIWSLHPLFAPSRLCPRSGG